MHKRTVIESLRRFRALCLCLALLLAVPAAGATAPGQEDPQGVILAALPTLRALLPPGRAVLDPQPLCTARLVGWDCPDPVREAAAALDLVLHGREFTYICLGGNRFCRLVGGHSLVSVSPPSLQGDEATLDARIWWRTGNRNRPVADRVERVRLRRTAGSWEVVGRG